MTFAVGMGALVAGNLTLLLSGAQPFAVFAACCFLGVHWAVIQVRCCSLEGDQAVFLPSKC